jgi:hypothetical protein
LTRCLNSGLHIAVRGSVEDHNEPKLFFSDKGLQFVQEVLNIKPQQLALKFEAWCVSGLGKNHSKHSLRPSNNLDHR